MSRRCSFLGSDAVRRCVPCQLTFISAPKYLLPVRPKRNIYFSSKVCPFSFVWYFFLSGLKPAEQNSRVLPLAASEINWNTSYSVPLKLLATRQKTGLCQNVLLSVRKSHMRWAMFSQQSFISYLSPQLLCKWSRLAPMGKRYLSFNNGATIRKNNIFANFPLNFS